MKATLLGIRPAGMPSMRIPALREHPGYGGMRMGKGPINRKAESLRVSPHKETYTAMATPYLSSLLVWWQPVPSFFLPLLNFSAER
jgi:hypothetical protein